MKIIPTLKQALKQVPDAFSCYQVDLICRLMGALIQTRSVNLKRLAAALSGSAQIDSHYRRLQRFFSSDLSPQVFTQLIAQRLVRPGKPLFFDAGSDALEIWANPSEFVVFRLAA